MATTLSAALRGNIQITLTDDLGKYTLPPIDFSDTLTNGTGADQADVVHVNRYSVTSGTPITLDLNGSLKMPNLANANFARMKWLIFINRDATNSLLIGGGSNPFTTWMSGTTPVRKVGPLGAEVVLNPSAVAFAVTASTADIIQIDASAGTVAFDVVLVGASA